MAKILLTAIVADIRGKLNGTVFSKNRGGNYIRTKTSPDNPQTTYQQEYRQAFGVVSSSFKALTPAQVASWNEATVNYPYEDKFGNTRYFSGKALFQLLNTHLLYVNQPMLTLPKMPVVKPSLLSPVQTLSTSSIEFDWSLGAVPTDWSLVVEATPPLVPSISFFKNLYRRFDVKAAATSLSGADFTAEYAARFGTRIVGQKISFRSYLVSNITGEKTTPFVSEAIVT